MTTGRRILGWLAPYRARVVCALILTTLACLLNLPVPLLVQGLIDHVVAGGRLRELPLFALGLLAVFAAQSGFGLANSLLIGRVGQRVVRDLRHRLYERLQRLGLAYFDKTPTGAIVSRVMDDVSAIQTFITGQTVTILTDLGTAVAVSALLMARSGRLAAVVLVFVALYVFTFPYFLRQIRATSVVIRAKMDILFGYLKEKLDGSIVIRVCAQEPAEEKEFGGQLADVHIPRVAENRLSVALSVLSAAISGVGAAAVFAVGASEVLRGRMTPGGVVSSAALAVMLFGPIQRLADLAYLFEQVAASVDRLGEILDLAPAPEAPNAQQPNARALGHVEFDRVGFGYEPNSPVVWDVRLRVMPGMKVALVGPTGCGKSTLISLLMRFYDPTWGEIRLDDTPITRIPTADLRRQIGVVLQDPVIFRQSVADNIRYGAPHATDTEVETAARSALVHDFVMNLPDGYNTIIGEGGYKLSQGERQRLAIARIFCMDPALIILDEATSSLDTASESLIQAALANLFRCRTAFIVAHRLSTIVDSDLIVVMEGGLINQMGTHAELLDDEDGLYHQLCLRQFGDPDPVVDEVFDAIETQPRHTASRARRRDVPPFAERAPHHRAWQRTNPS